MDRGVRTKIQRVSPSHQIFSLVPLRVTMHSALGVTSLCHHLGITLLKVVTHYQLSLSVKTHGCGAPRHFDAIGTRDLLNFDTSTSVYNTHHQYTQQIP